MHLIDLGVALTAFVLVFPAELPDKAPGYSEAPRQHVPPEGA